MPDLKLRTQLPWGTLAVSLIRASKFTICQSPFFGFFDKEPPRRRRSQDKQYAALAETAALPGCLPSYWMLSSGAML